MGALFENHEGVACRACGAARAAPDPDARYGVCKSCWAKFTNVTDPHERTQMRFNRWLARQIYLSARRLKVFGVTGRCEAISGWLYNDGYQCGLPAVTLRDGRRACHAHGNRATATAFVGDQLTTPYDTFRELFTDLARHDPLFRECLSDALTDVPRDEGDGQS